MNKNNKKIKISDTLFQEFNININQVIYIVMK
jgi:hypothetical protein